MTQSREILLKMFRQLGADDPEGWASSQVDEGIPQLHRFLFLKKAWSRVANHEDDGWIEGAIEEAKHNPQAPFAGAGSAMARMLASGVARSDIVDLVRSMQAQLLFDLCYLLEDPSLEEDEGALLGDIGWALVTTDADFEPTAETIDGLHESVLEMDPTGQEMRPTSKP